jgi:hypothetical protein
VGNVFRDVGLHPIAVNYLQCVLTVKLKQDGRCHNLQDSRCEFGLPYSSLIKSIIFPYKKNTLQSAVSSFVRLRYPRDMASRMPQDGICSVAWLRWPKLLTRRVRLFTPTRPGDLRLAPDRLGVDAILGPGDPLVHAQFPIDTGGIVIPARRGAALIAVEWFLL